jgi:penicillin-binding protein 2
MLTTPLQLAHATALLAVGKSYPPRLLVAMQAPGQASVTAEQQASEPLMIRSQEHLQAIHKAMVAVVHGERGTARASGRGAKYQMAGKTGTAQVISTAQDAEYDEELISKRHRDHALFVAFAPAEAPRLAIAVLVENGGHGSSAAAPVARRVFDRFFAKEENNAVQP